jgi:ABC-type bacteriocin/lantibiotic exporter with double-glycine peptidase domain
MILTYYGRNTDPAECRESCGIGRDGVSAQTLVEAARRYGLRVRAFSLRPADLTKIPLPAIAYWRNSHFVVVERCSPDRIEIVDPASWRQRLTFDQFASEFTGLVLTFEPGNHLERRRKTGQPRSCEHLIQVMREPRNRWTIVQILAASILLQVLGLALPVFTKVLVDDVLPLMVTNIVTTLGIGMIVLMLALAITAYLRAALLIYLEARLDSRLVLGFFEHLLALPFQFFQLRATGDLMSRLGSITVIRDALTNQTVSAALDGTLVLIYLAVLLSLQPVFGAVAAGLGLLQLALLLGTTRRACSLMQRELAADADSQSYIVEALNGMATLKASGGEDRVLNHWADLFGRHLKISLQRKHLSAVVGSALTMLHACSPLVLLWMGAVYVLDGRMTLGTMLALNAIAISLLTPVASVVLNCQQILMVGAHLERVADVLNAEREQTAHTVSASKLRGRIELKNVHFRYHRNGPTVLRNISVIIGAGWKIALVGGSGSGKSTLAKLLLGFYNPDEGEIVYDGVPMACLNYRTVRRQIGAVLQESFLFRGSIRQNIAFNNPSLPLESVVSAARLAHIHDDIVAMPMGYETIVAEGGSSFSGGQRQRLSIARALAHSPSVLLLDEATSHLDAETERLVDESLAGLSCTRIVIAHRLSTVRNADLILVLQDGAIIESGSHEELLRMDGQYVALVQGARNGTNQSGRD